MSSVDYTLRQLVAEDWPLWKEIRLESLVDSPAAFGGAFEEESVKEDAFFRDNIVNNSIWGAFNGNDLLGVVGFVGEKGERYRHRGKIFGVYTVPSARGKGISKKLLLLAIDYAKTRVMWLAIHVWTENAGAYRLYQSVGFVTYCTERNCLRVSDTEVVDYHLMRIDFK